MALSLLKVDPEGCEVPVLRFLADSLPEIDAIYPEYRCEPDRLTIDQSLKNDFLLFHASARVPHCGILGYLHERHVRKGGMNACIIG